MIGGVGRLLGYCSVCYRTVIKKMYPKDTVASEGILGDENLLLSYLFGEVSDEHGHGVKAL